MSEPTPVGADAGPAPAPTRTAGRPQAVVLLFASCLSVLGAVLLAPVLPRMQQAFAGTPGVEALVPIALTVPALVIGLLAPFAGAIVDRFGRKRLLVGALVVYAAFGTAPLWLDALPLIVASRAGVGLAEAAIMTCCTTLIADYFAGRERDRYFGLQTVFTSLSAVLFFGLGGALGDLGWRAPFWLYAVSLVLAVLVGLFIWQPERSATPATGTGGRLAPIPWRALAVPCVVTLFGGIVFYAPIVELPFVLDGIGVTSTATIGQVSAVAAVATAAGAISFTRIGRFGPRTLLPVAFGLAGAGLVVMASGSAVVVVAVGATIASAGTGLLLPTLLTWAISPLDFAQRGRGTGLWTASFFIGQFACPLLILALAGGLGGLPTALVLLGVASAGSGVAVLAALSARRDTQPAG
jgi:MFS family permease